MRKRWADLKRIPGKESPTSRGSGCALKVVGKSRIREVMRALLRSARGLARSQCARTCTSLPNSEVQLLQQVSRLEARIHELEQERPAHVQPAKITDWEDLGFGIVPTNGHVRYTWSSKTSSWDAGRFIADPYISLHVHAAVLHYGMCLFEGCKVSFTLTHSRLIDLTQPAPRRPSVPKRARCVCATSTRTGEPNLFRDEAEACALSLGCMLHGAVPG